MTVIAVILAGGEGRRMGGADKALLSLGGRALISHVIDALRPQLALPRPGTPGDGAATAPDHPDGHAPIVISANGDPARFDFTRLKILADEIPRGPLSGILAALRHAGTIGAEHVVSVPVDAPFLPADLIARLSQAIPQPGFARAGGRDHNATAIWPARLADPLADFLASGAKAKIADFAALHGAKAVDFPDTSAFDNLNTPADLQRAESREP